MEQLKILVVDDEARMRKLVKDFLSVKGFTVLEASNGEEAVDLFFEQKDIAPVSYTHLVQHHHGGCISEEGVKRFLSFCGSILVSGKSQSL